MNNFLKNVKKAGINWRVEFFFGLLFLVISLVAIFDKSINLGGTLGEFAFTILMSVLGAGVGSVLKLSALISHVRMITSDIAVASQRQNETIDKIEQVFICDRIQKYHKGWEDWKNHIFHDALVSPHYAPEIKAWIKMMELYIDDETSLLGDKTLRTTSDLYVNLLEGIGELLSDRYQDLNVPREHPVFRYQITGMLPEEFFNGYQLERTINHESPIIFFNHSWENPNKKNSYDSLHSNPVANKIKVRRCIVVREPHLQDRKLKCLSSVAELEHQCKLQINVRSEEPASPMPRNIGHITEEKMIAERLLWKNGERSWDSEKIINDTIGVEHWECYPIIHEMDALNLKGNYKLRDWKWENLIEFFCKNYHSEAETDALYYVFRDDLKSRYSGLVPHFEEGTQPEIALFGPNVETGNKLQHEWSVGIVGRYRPFTREIHLNFLSGHQLQELVTSLGFLRHKDDESIDDGPRSLMHLLKESRERIDGP